MTENELLILLTNDDGVGAPGLAALREALRPLGRVIVAAPNEERSATSHALTIHQPIRIKPVAEDTFAVTGNPADCVVLALRKILPRLPDLAVSGINHGGNLGDDVIYSGTVAGAREAAVSGIPAFAFSLLSRSVEDYGPAARFARRLVQELFPDRIPEGTFFNVNIPNGEALQYRFTRQGHKRVANAVEEKEDPRGQAYYWIGQDQSEWIVETDTDYQAVRQGLVSVTPLQRDQTNYFALRDLTRREKIELADRRSEAAGSRLARQPIPIRKP